MALPTGPESWQLPAFVHQIRWDQVQPPQSIETITTIDQEETPEL